MNIGYVSFRLSGTDGVSLETAKAAQVMQRMGHSNYYFAGEFDPPNTDKGVLNVEIDGQMCSDVAHFNHPSIVWITQNAFGSKQEHPDLRIRMERHAATLKRDLMRFIEQFKLDLIVAENVFAIPLNLPLSMALRRAIAETGIRTIAHNHDFYWERERYKLNCVDDTLYSTFPPKLPNIVHAVINTQAQTALAERGFVSYFLPNVFDFEYPPNGKDKFNADLRSELGIRKDELFFLQPTRVVPRKGIELSIELVRRLNDLPIKLVITHHAEASTLDYLGDVFALAARADVRIRYLPQRFETQRRAGTGIRKIYGLWDAYVYADFITYPSLYEGFGNALLETVYYKKPLLVNRYRVYKDDIEPTGLDAVVIDGEVTNETAEEVRELLANPARIKQMVEHNFAIGLEHFSYKAAEKRLTEVLAAFD